MASNKKLRGQKSLLSRTIQTHWPIWYQPGAALGSAVRYLAALSVHYQWVAIYILKGTYLELGPFVGAPSERIKVPRSEGDGTSSDGQEQDFKVLRRRNLENSDLNVKRRVVVGIRNSKGKLVGEVWIESDLDVDLSDEEEQ